MDFYIDNNINIVNSDSGSLYYKQNDDIFLTDIIDDDLDYWEINDFLNNILNIYNDDEYEFTLSYNSKSKLWFAKYINLISNNILYECKNINRYECLKELYNKLKNNIND